MLAALNDWLRRLRGPGRRLNTDLRLTPLKPVGLSGSAAVSRAAERARQRRTPEVLRRAGLRPQEAAKGGIAAALGQICKYL
jgi:hypothetical protein